MNKERECFRQENSELRASTIELSTQNQKLVEVRTLLENNLWERQKKLRFAEQDMQDVHEDLAAVRGELKVETQNSKKFKEKYNEAVKSKKAAEEK